MELTNTITCDIMFTLQNWMVISKATSLKSVRIDNLIFRGVAKVVSRQFRVLETVGSSPAASTKKKNRESLMILCSFYVDAGGLTRTQLL